jgi:hypothetical protein
MTSSTYDSFSELVVRTQTKTAQPASSHHYFATRGAYSTPSHIDVTSLHLRLSLISTFFRHSHPPSSCLAAIPPPLPPTGTTPKVSAAATATHNSVFCLLAAAAATTTGTAATSPPSRQSIEHLSLVGSASHCVLCTEVLFAEIVSRREGHDCVRLMSELGERRIFCSLVLLFLPITRIVVSTRYAFSVCDCSHSDYLVYHHLYLPNNCSLSLSPCEPLFTQC